MARNLVAWCNVRWSASPFEMATLSQCLHFLILASWECCHSLNILLPNIHTNQPVVCRWGKIRCLLWHTMLSPLSGETANNKDTNVLLAFWPLSNMLFSLNMRWYVSCIIYCMWYYRHGQIFLVVAYGLMLIWRQAVLIWKTQRNELRVWNFLYNCHCCTLYQSMLHCTKIMLRCTIMTYCTVAGKDI